MRIAIAGPPKSGKTTLAAELGIPVRHTDDVQHMGWSAASDEISRWFDEPGPWCVEGVAVLRALRKWRARNLGAVPPLDRLIYLHHARIELNTGQQRMATQLARTYAELERWLEPVLERGPSIGGGFPPSSARATGARSAGHRPPVPISCAKTTKSRPPKAKPASKRDTKRVRGERKFALATPPELAPEVDPRGGELAPIVTTAYLQAFERLGGVTGLVRWGRKNPSAFYRTLASLAPALGRLAGKGHGLVVQVAQFAEGQGRVIDGTPGKAADDPDST